MPRALRILALVGTVASLAALSPATADAQVRYEFTAFSSFPIGSLGEVTGSWSAVLAGFATDGTVLVPSALESCTATSSLIGPVACDNQTFQPFTFASDDVIGFGVDGATVYYYFDDAVFQTLGTHETNNRLGPQQAGRLVVSLVSVPVPEPSSAVLVVSALAGLFAARRRRSVPR